ncbi:hypothetical protein SLEP1_g58981 [Rubroshorea leprosula]|uniref:Uncharacterized protein n=1 Tax=Rubroshorea leprosula TaxID=152421 RepID=A0AAV5MR27_9ROSI|nr:hypothetical protein SLEP1_g58981 [Rubroshorea leprosula]
MYYVPEPKGRNPIWVPRRKEPRVGFLMGSSQGTQIGFLQRNPARTSWVPCEEPNLGSSRRGTQSRFLPRNPARVPHEFLQRNPT